MNFDKLIDAFASGGKQAVGRGGKMNDVFLYLCGAAGALIYAFPMFLGALTSVPPGKYPALVLMFAMFVGALIAAAFTPALGHRWGFLVDPTPYPLAIGVGLAANPLVPIFLGKITGWADTFKIGGK